VRSGGVNSVDCDYCEGNYHFTHKERQKID
jgi:redox-regulated HSP33 family molecular chaperone